MLFIAPMKQKYRHLFFDLDRTLWDYDHNSKEALLEIYQTYGLHAIFVDFDNFHKSFSRHNNELWKGYREGTVHKDVVRTLRFERALFDFGTSDPDLANKLNHDFLEISPRKTHLIPGTIELLDYLKKKEVWTLHYYQRIYKNSTLENRNYRSGGLFSKNIYLRKHQ